MNPSEETLTECLSATGLRALPEKLDLNDNRTWLRSICLVTKCGGFKNYVLCENDGKGHPVVKRDFGACSAIVFFDSIHPFEFADKTIVPTFKDDNAIIAYLCKSKYDRAEIEALIKAGDREEIQRRINDVSLGLAKRKKQEESRVKKMKEMAEAAKAEKEKSRSNGRRKKKND